MRGKRRIEPDDLIELKQLEVAGRYLLHGYMFTTF